jgi:DNA-binding transcriptional LysR family regulator
VPELRHLRYFLAVADELNFTRAAERVGVSQQVLSSQIRQLEGELGVQLFDRSTHHVALTEAGRALAERGGDVLAAVEGLWEEARLRARGAEGLLRFAFARSGSYDTTPLLIAAMREAHPEVEVIGLELAAPELPRAARDGRADVVMLHWGEGATGLFSREVRRMRHGVVVRDDDPLAEHEVVRLPELADRPLLVPGPELASAQRAAIVRACLDAGFEPELATPAVPFDPGFRDVSFGRGAAVAPESAQPRLPRDLRWVPFERGVLDGVATLAWDPARSSPARDLFVEVAEQVSVQEGWSAQVDR